VLSDFPAAKIQCRRTAVQPRPSLFKSQAQPSPTPRAIRPRCEATVDLFYWLKKILSYRYAATAAAAGAVA
jgi:hypothetical protein